MPSQNEKKSRVPLRHLSSRVPWHDHGWAGMVCKNPKANAACLALDRIRQTRKDNLEMSVAGKLLSSLPTEQWPACVAERGTFMSAFDFEREVKHPYAETSDYHRHLLPTQLRMPAYSASSIPFRWMNRYYAWEIAAEYDIAADPEREPTEPAWLSNKNHGWIQNHENQRALLDGFFSALVPEQSLCFFYAKQTPLALTD